MTTNFRSDAAEKILLFCFDFIKVFHASLNRLLMFTPLPESIRADQFLYRTQGGIEYDLNIDKVKADILEGWRGRLGLQMGLCYSRNPPLRLSFGISARNPHSGRSRLVLRILNLALECTISVRK